MAVLLLIEIKGMKFPLDRKYYIKNGAHIWLKSEGYMIKIGLDAFAAEMAGSINYLNVKKGRVKKNEEFGSFESSKFVNKLYSPVSGEIIKVNDPVLLNPHMINENPYNSWIVTIKLENKDYDCEHIVEGKDKILKWINKEIKKNES